MTTITRSEARARLRNIYPLVKPSAEEEYAQPMSTTEVGAETIPLVRWHMKGFFEQVIETYEKLVKANGGTPKFKACPFPSIDDHQIAPEEFEETGMLAKDSAKVVMKALYGCRYVRFDLLWPVGDCARHTSKWSKAYDRRLEKLIGHIKGTLDHGLEGFVGDKADECQVLC